MTPARLTMPSRAIKPNDVPTNAKPVNAPINPSGTVSNTASALVAELN